MKASDIPEFYAGKVYGRWTLLEQGPRTKHYARWWCQCLCGTRRAVPEPHLRKGTTQSCGCLCREHVRAKLRTHGLTRTGTYRSWQSMRNRCYKPTTFHYENYGGRGITVCERWRHSFDNFLADMGIRPGPKYTIDRKDGNGNYEPSNCKWSTPQEQWVNRRDAAPLTFQGRSQLLAAWARELKLPKAALYQRLRYGWSVEETLTTPIQRRRPNRH